MYCFLLLFSPKKLSMDLPPDKAKLLKNYDDEKKWDIICDQVRNKQIVADDFNLNHTLKLSSQEMVQAKDPPSHYLTKLRTYLDPKASRSHRVRFDLPPLFISTTHETIRVQINSCVRETYKNLPKSQTTFGDELMTPICVPACMFCFFSVCSMSLEGNFRYKDKHHHK